jgi:hypothetical protein
MIQRRDLCFHHVLNSSQKLRSTQEHKGRHLKLRLLTLTMQGGGRQVLVCHDLYHLVLNEVDKRGKMDEGDMLRFL